LAPRAGFGWRSSRTLIRPDVDAAAYYYDERRKTELLSERRQLREDELNRLERRIGVLDLEIWGLQRLRTLELRADLKRSGFDVTGLEPLPCPTDAERQASRHRSRPDIDALTSARAEEAANRGRLVRTFTAPIKVR